MRKLTSVIALWLCLALSLSAQTGVSYRLIDNRFDENQSELYVDIQIRADGSQFILADQYYRFYFDSDNMSLDTDYSQSHLPNELYYDMSIIESIEGFDASEVGALNYDQNLGFANIYIELADAIIGGTRITKSEGWVTIGTLRFDIKEGQAPSRATWAREGLTAQYASAYSVVSEWKQENVIETLSANSYSDLNFIQSQSRSAEIISIEIGPNPTTDFIRVQSSGLMNNGSFISLTDLAGNKVAHQSFSQQHQVKLAVSDLSSGTYIVEVYNEIAERIEVQKIVVAK